MNKILSFGDLNIDLIIHLDDSDIKSTTAEILTCGQAEDSLDAQIIESPGGTLYNFACGFAKLGGEVGIVGAVGDDHLGRKLKTLLNSIGADTKGIVTVVDPTLMVLCLIDESGDRRFRTYPARGAAFTKLSISDIDDSVFEEYSHLYMSGVLLYQSPIKDTALWIMEKFKNLGKPVIFDVNLRTGLFGFTKEHRERFIKAISLSTIVFGSGSDELSVISGEQDIIMAAKYFKRDDNIIVSKNGPDGAFAVTSDKLIQQDAFDVPVVDTVGAGDIFNAGFITAYLQGLEIEEALLWGSATSAYSIMRDGTHFADEKEIEALIEQYRDRG